MVRNYDSKLDGKLNVAYRDSKYFMAPAGITQLVRLSELYQDKEQFNREDNILRYTIKQNMPLKFRFLVVVRDAIIRGYGNPEF